MDSAQSLGKKIAEKKSIVGIIGMGYVGQAIADLIAAKHYETIGFVRSEGRAATINKQKHAFLSATTDTSLLKKCDVILICVQTPIDEKKSPDLQYLKKAASQVATHLRKGQLIIIESSIAVGTTRNIVLPILKQSKLKEDEDFFLSFSPERVDPGNTHFSLNQISKVVSGLDEKSQQLAVAFYQSFIDKVIPVSSLETAELVKLFENTFRLVNISLVNELNTYVKKKNINIWEVITAAATKPFGFLAHYPSPGAGGHCIPVDPFYLLDDARIQGVNLNLVEEAARINDTQPKKVVGRALEILMKKEDFQGDFVEEFFPRHYSAQEQYEREYAYNYAGLKGGRSSHKGADISPAYNILLLGLAYKPDIDDIRESPALKIWRQLEELGCTVSYHDPYVPSYNDKVSQTLTPSFIQNQDLIIITTNHSMPDYKNLASYGVPILDTRNVYGNNTAAHIYGL